MEKIEERSNMKMFLLTLASCFSFYFIASADDVTRKAFGDWEVAEHGTDEFCSLEWFPGLVYVMQDGNMPLFFPRFNFYGTKGGQTFAILGSEKFIIKPGITKAVFNFDSKYKQIIKGSYNGEEVYDGFGKKGTTNHVIFLGKNSIVQLLPYLKKHTEVNIMVNNREMSGVSLRGFTKALSEFERCINSESILKKGDPFE